MEKINKKHAFITNRLLARQEYDRTNIHLQSPCWKGHYSENYKITLLLLDMSKVFDTVRKNIYLAF